MASAALDPVPHGVVHRIERRFGADDRALDLPQAASKRIVRELPLHKLVENQSIFLPIDIHVDAEAHEMVVIYADQVGCNERSILRVRGGGRVVHPFGRNPLGRNNAVCADTDLDLPDSD